MLGDWKRVWSLLGLPCGFSLVLGREPEDGDASFGSVKSLKDSLNGYSLKEYEMLSRFSLRTSGLFTALLLLVASSALAADERYNVRWSNGLHISRADGQVKLSLGGRTYLDLTSVSGSRTIKAIPGATGTGAEFRAARLYVAGTLFERLAYKSNFDFAGGTVKLKDVYVGLKKIPALGTVKIGHFKEPFGLENLTSSRFTSFMERALPVLFAPSRNVGIQFANGGCDGRMTWSVGAFRDYGNNGSSFTGTGNYNVTGRVTGLPLFQNGGERLIHLGVAYSHQFRKTTGLNPTFATGPESHITENFASTGALASDGIDLVGAEMAVVFGPAAVQGEFMLASVKPKSGGRANLNGAYAEASYFITGEHRPYNKKKGAFDRVPVKRPFDPQAGAWGAWQIAARYSRVDLEHNFSPGQKLQDVTGGLNWYLFSNCRLMLNYVYAKVLDGGGHAHIAQMRTQIDF